MMVVRLEDWREDPERRDLSGLRATKTEGRQFPDYLHGPIFCCLNLEDWREDPESSTFQGDLSGLRATETEGGQSPHSLAFEWINH